MNRRLAWVNVSRTTIENVVVQGAQFEIISGVPLGASLVRIVTGADGDSLRMLFQSDAFAEVGPSDPIPDVNLQGTPIP